VAVSPTALRNERGKIIGAINCLYDITEPKRAEEALRQSEEFHRALVSQTNVGMARSDLKGRFAFVNETFCQMLGYKKAELAGKKIADVTHPDDRKETRRLFQRIVRKGTPYQFEKRYLRKDGSVIWVNVSASPICNDRRKTQSAIAVIVDITDRKKAEAALKKSQLQLEELVERRTQALRETNVELKSEIERRKGLEGEILSISDREQQRLGQELHDGLCQQLTAIGLMARATTLRLKNHRVIDVEDLENITQLINESVISARNISRDLHRDEVDAAGFIPALQALVERKVWMTPCRIEIKTDVNLSDDNAAAEIYRILREALINANKHAKASQIVLEVARSDGEVFFSITDNGVGMSSKPPRGRGLGFHIMQHRARSIGARLELESPRRGGTRVVCHLPLSK
jgi:PAS domain S-box-containing protein